MIMPAKKICAWFVAGATGICAAAQGGSITLDGSLGHAAGPVASNNGLYSLTPASGKQVGGNLFFSLGKFNLDKGETAQFSGPGSVANILTRVTGGASSIDGTIQSTIAGANFYLINPAGIMFGPDAALNVMGSFAVTTADQIKFADQTTFGSPGTADATLSTAAPTAFGFLSASPAGVSVNGATLAVPAGQAFTIASGNLAISGGRIEAGGGEINVVSAGSAGNAVLTGSAANPIDASAIETLGPVTITGGGGLIADGPGGGRIVIRAGQLQLDSANITAITQGAGTGAGIDVQVSGELSVSNGTLGAGTSGSGRGGDLNIQAQTLSVHNGGVIDSEAVASGDGGDVSIAIRGAATLDGTDAPNSFTGLSASTESTQPGGGRGGNLAFSSASLTLKEALIIADTFGTGDGGSLGVTVRGPELMDGAGAPNTGIGSQSSDLDIGGGAGGEVMDSAESLLVKNEASISASTFGGGAGGDVRVDVSGPVVLNGLGSFDGVTGISASSQAINGGKSGNVTLTAGSLAVVNGALISAGTEGLGAGGNVVVEVAGNALLQGHGITVTGIRAPSDDSDDAAAGGGGSVSVSAGSLIVRSGASISADTSGSGAAGDLNVNVAGNILLDGNGDSSGSTGIVSDSFAGAGGGNSGRVIVRAGSLNITNGATIDASTSGTGSGGDMSVMVSGAIVLDGTATPGSITGLDAETDLRRAGGGEGGDIFLSAGSLQIDEANIGAASFGSGPGGDITIQIAGSIVDNGHGDNTTGIFADSEFGGSSGGGAGGSVNVSARAMTVTDGAGVDADTFGTGVGGDVNLNIAGPLLVDGMGSTNVNTFISADSNLSAFAGGGNGGKVTIRAQSLTVANGASISTSTGGTGNSGDVALLISGPFSVMKGSVEASSFGAGAGGSVRIVADDANLQTGLIAARSELKQLGAGAAGSVRLRTSGKVTLQNTSGIEVIAEAADGGSVRVAGANIDIDDSVITANAGENGGSIVVRSPGTVLVRESSLIAEAFGDGGNITIDPALVVLDRSTLAADAVHGNGGNVSITAGQFLSFDTTINVSSQFGVAGSVLVSSPDTDIAGSLVPLRADLAGKSVGLQPTCADSAGSDDSSFISAGRGGLPPEPGGFVFWIAPADSH